MSKKRVQLRLTHYEGKKKNNKEKWETIGEFKTIQEAYDAGAVKACPRYQK